MEYHFQIIGLIEVFVLLWDILMLLELFSVVNLLNGKEIGYLDVMTLKSTLLVKI